MTTGRNIKSFYRIKREANVWEQNSLPQYLVLSYSGSSGPLPSRHQGGIRKATFIGPAKDKGKGVLEKGDEIA